jgi:hypothetical protein
MIRQFQIKANYLHVYLILFCWICYSAEDRKFLINLRFHEKYFGIIAEWRLYAASHGSGQCDGVAGTAKGIAANPSLQ